MRIAPTHHHQEPDYYELALLLAHGQTESLEQDWGTFVDHLSRICDGFARTRATKTSGPPLAELTQFIPA